RCTIHSSLVSMSFARSSFVTTRGGTWKPRPRIRLPRMGPTLDVEVPDVQRVLVDEVAARIDGVTHQHREDLVGLDRVLDLHLPQDPLRGIHRGLPELVRVHLAETLVALDLEALPRAVQELLEEEPPAGDRSARRRHDRERRLRVEIVHESMHGFERLVVAETAERGDALLAVLERGHEQLV